MMTLDPQPWSRVATYTYEAVPPSPGVTSGTDHDDQSGCLPGVGDPTGQAQEPPTGPKASPTRPKKAALFDCAHDREQGIFRIRWPDGEVEVFRDKPVRHLVVEPDAETGELKPVLTRGYPTYLYLCREERELR